MAAIKVPTPFNIDVEFEIPEFYRRLIALLIDILILYFYLRLAVEVYKFIARDANPFDLDTNFNLDAVKLVLFVLPILVYHVVLEITMNGQSVGKKNYGAQGRQREWWTGQHQPIYDPVVIAGYMVFTIFFVGLSGLFQTAESVFITLFALLFFVAEIVLVVSSKKSQRLGDILARTILIRTNRQSSIEETVFQEVADNYTPSFPQIMQLSDRDINAIKSILETARKKGDMDMAAAASEKIKSHLKIDSPISPFEFLEILLKDYNYLSVK